MQEHECVAVAGNSMGWYTALAVGGRALASTTASASCRRCRSCSTSSRPRTAAARCIYPLVDEDWRPRCRARASASRARSRARTARRSRSIRPRRLRGARRQRGGHRAPAAARCPKVKLGANAYPFRLDAARPVPHAARRARSPRARATRSPTSRSARPRRTLVDGRGARFTPWSTRRRRAARRTRSARRSTTPYDFTQSIRVALREHAPDHLVLPGPGNSLGGVCGQILVAEGWRGVHTKDDFERVQDGDSPILVSMRR